MSEQEEFTGDECVVLPSNYLNSVEAVADIYSDQLAAASSNYLNSVEAVADIYSDQLAAASSNFDIGPLSHPRRILRAAVLVPLIWALSAIWTVCF